MDVAFENPCPGQANGLAAYYFAQAVQMLLATHCTLGNPEDYPKDSGDGVKQWEEFDFVVVGGGSSGAVVASRLSEERRWRVLLVESGGDPTFESDIPGFGVSLPGRELDWKFRTSGGGRCCLGMEEESCAVFQGKVLGGTSTINRMHYLRGCAEDYEGWGWGFEEVLRYFKKSEKVDEDFRIVKDGEQDSYFEEAKRSAGGSDSKLNELSKILAGRYHSKAGLLSVNHFAYDFYVSEVKKAVFAAAEELGVPHVGDANGRCRSGFVRALGTIHEGNRGNVAKAFLTPCRDRENLVVVKNATVERILFEGRKATGVRFVRNGEVRTVSVRKEVILSAGAINTPRLLLLSGVGPREQLERAGVEVVQDLSGVGENLQAQLTFFGLPVALKGMTRSVSHLQKIDAMYRFISRGTGLFGSVGMTDVVGFVSTGNDSRPDVEILHYLNHVRDYYTFNELLISLKIKDDIRDQFAKAYATSDVLLICPTLLRPNSRGRVQLSGPTFKHPLRIDAGFLSDPEDVKALIRGVRFGLGMTRTAAFADLQPEVLKLEVEGCRGLEFDSDEHWECLIRHLATSMHDAAGTCRMGPRGDSSAVVDGSLKVHGVKGLRVADSSVMPSMVGGSVSIAAVMIGEKASDLVKEEWGKRRKDEL